MSKSNQAQVRCLCGNTVIVLIGGRRKRCKCGVLLSARRNRNGQVTPWARITEGMLAERKRAGKPVRHRRPKIMRWIWSTLVGGKFVETANERV